MNKLTLDQSINNQRGAALITALVFLVILTMLALSSMNTNIMDERMAGNSQEKNRAFQAAETALVVALENNDAFKITNYSGTVDDIGTYQADTTYALEFLEEKSAASVFQSGSLITGSSSGQMYNFYNLTVTASTPSGASASIDAGAWHL
jgi:Tfp pilus assembly protein PilV